MATAAKTVGTHITKDPGVCGGKACVDYTRIRVMDVVLLHRRGLKAEDMAEYFSVPLSLAQIHGALAYYYDHPEEVERDILDGKRIEAEIERDRDLQLKNHRAE
jgi:uncharacterized protein (DUF433 family)